MALLLNGGGEEAFEFNIKFSTSSFVVNRRSAELNWFGEQRRINNMGQEKY